MDLISVKVEDLYIKCGQKVCRTKFIGKTPVAGAGWAKAPHFSPEVDKKKDSKSMCVFKPTELFEEKGRKQYVAVWFYAEDINEIVDRQNV